MNIYARLSRCFSTRVLEETKTIDFFHSTGEQEENRIKNAYTIGLVVANLTRETR